MIVVVIMITTTTTVIIIILIINVFGTAKILLWSESVRQGAFAADQVLLEGNFFMLLLYLFINMLYSGLFKFFTICFWIREPARFCVVCLHETTCVHTKRSNWYRCVHGQLKHVSLNKFQRRWKRMSIRRTETEVHTACSWYTNLWNFMLFCTHTWLYLCSHCFKRLTLIGNDLSFSLQHLMNN